MTVVTLTLPYRPPYDWERMLAFFRERAIPGVEWADDTTYRRTIRLSTTRGILALRHVRHGNALKLDLRLADNRELMMVVERVRRMFDLDANPQAIHETGIMKALQGGNDRPSLKQVTARAEAWRPWRAYATVYLWLGLEGK